jgi:putative ABC transport system permease protein
MILRTLLSHYRRHPVQAVFLLVGVVIANVLLTGTLLINAQARASYERGEQLLQSAPVARIQARDARSAIDERDYIRLRRAGFDMLAPTLRRQLTTAEGARVELLGIDLLAMRGSSDFGAAGRERAAGGFTGFSFPPYELWGAAGRLRQLGWNQGSRPELDSGARLPMVRMIEDRNLGHRLMLDIGALQALANSPGALSWISVFPSAPERLGELKKALPDYLELVTQADSADPSELTRSFHLNLAAMGLLTFVVGVFLMYNAIAFSYTDRLGLIRRMRLAGVTRGALRRSLLFELVIFLAIGGLLGFWLGALLASALLPGVGRTLAQLYDVYIAYPDSLMPGSFLPPALMTALGALLCTIFPMREALDTPLLERWQGGWLQTLMVRRDRIFAMAGAGFLCLSWLMAIAAESLWAALAGMASLLLGAALLLPIVLRLVLAALARLAPPRRARVTWLLADSRWLLGPASLALMAMTLALVANSGLNTMISSFRLATGEWLEQRLAADLYIRADRSPEEVREWLEPAFPGIEVSERYRTVLNQPAPAGHPSRVEVVSLQEGERYRGSVRLLKSADEAPSRFASAGGIYISERAWRIEGWQVGQAVELCDRQPAVPVLGVYHDYGNPLPQWLASRDLFRSCWPGLAPASLAISGNDSTPWTELRESLRVHLGVKDEQIIDQAGLRAVGMAVFDRTFTVTRALNALTLLVAGIGIFCAISAIHHHRVSQQALLATLGVSRRERGLMLLAQWALFGLLCMIVVWPFGTMLAAYLGYVVTPVAFGWSFPLRPDTGHYLDLAIWSCASLLLAVLLPSWRLLRASPAVLLREESMT